MLGILSAVHFASNSEFIVELNCGAISALTSHHTLQLQIYIFAHNIECVDKFLAKNSCTLCQVRLLSDAFTKYLENWSVHIDSFFMHSFNIWTFSIVLRHQKIKSLQNLQRVTPRNDIGIIKHRKPTIIWRNTLGFGNHQRNTWATVDLFMFQHPLRVNSPKCLYFCKSSKTYYTILFSIS